MLRVLLQWIAVFTAIGLVMPGEISACVSPRLDRDLSQANGERVKAICHQSDLIFVGIVTKLGPAPGFWSGRIKATQTVTYDLDHTLKGQFAGKKIDVAHLVVHGSRNADTATIGLSPNIFAVGRKLIVLVRKVNGGHEDFEENLTMPFSETNESALKSFLR